MAVSTSILVLGALPGRAPPAPAMNHLAEAAASGDREAFSELHRRTVPRVYALCLRLSGDPARAEELTQDVYVRVWERLASFRGDSAFTTWLHRLTVNVVLSERRSASRRWRHQEAAQVELHRSRPAPPGLALDLERAIARLPEGAREVFVLHDIEGYRHEEVAGAAGIAVGTSKAQLFRARRLLREMLDP